MKWNGRCCCSAMGCRLTSVLKNAKEVFINNMLKIWSDNQERFNVNMETKEKKLTEDFMEHITALPKSKK